MLGHSVTDAQCTHKSVCCKDQCEQAGTTAPKVAPAVPARGTGRTAAGAARFSGTWHRLRHARTRREPARSHRCPATRLIARFTLESLLIDHMLRRAGDRLPAHAAATAAEYSHCPQLSQALDAGGTSAPALATDGGSRVFQYVASQEYYMDLASHTYHLSSHGGFTFVMTLKFNADPATSTYMVLLTLRPGGTGTRRIQVYTVVNVGTLTFDMCGTTACYQITSDAPVPPGVWTTIACRYVAATARMEIWFDGELASWADTLNKSPNVRIRTAPPLTRRGPPVRPCLLIHVPGALRWHCVDGSPGPSVQPLWFSL